MDVRWKKGANFSVPADAAFAAIEEVRLANAGEATADLVVETAKDKDHVLHPEFEWNNAKAGHQYRLITARSIMRSFVVVRSELSTDRPQRVYEVVRQQSQAPGRIRSVYKRSEDILADPELRAELIARLLKELINMRARLRDVQEFAIVVRAIDEVLLHQN